MGIVTAVATYFLIWWTILFVTLPMGYRQADAVEPGQQPGAPRDPQLKRKFVMTTILATLVWGILFVLSLFFVPHEVFSSQTEGNNGQAGTEKPAPDNRTPVIDLLHCRKAFPDLDAGADASTGVEYVPGVDVHGRPVAPAELESNSGISSLTTTDFEFPVTVDLGTFLGFQPVEGYQAEAGFGVVRYQGGEFFYNDRPFEPEQRRLLRQMCLESLAQEHRSPAGR